MRRSNSTTLKDVAREAGVTVMAASVVLNGAVSSARVGPATRARILEAAARLRYRRNVAALGLSRRRMNTIGVVSTIVSRTVNLYYVEVLTGILATAAEHGQSTSILTIGSWTKDESRIIEFCDGRIDGLILIGPEVTPAFADLLVQHAPVVALHGSGSRSIPTIDVDNAGGARLATQYLLDLGHTQLLHLAGRPTAKAGIERIAGFRGALEDRSVEFRNEMLLPGDFVSESGYSRTLALADRVGKGRMPTGIVCANDAIAFGCMDALRERRISVPGDVSVVGFDDTLLARIVRPALTTIHQPFADISRRAVETLLAQIEMDQLAGPLPAGSDFAVENFPEETVAVNLIIGESTGPPRRSDA